MNDLQVKKDGGFTLIELMVTLSIAAILLTVGVPSFKEYIANQQARTATQDLVAALLYTRSEAVKRNASVRLSIDRDSNNNLQGWAVSEVEVTNDTNKSYSDCTASPTPSDCLTVKAAQRGIKLSDGLTSITFEPSGRLRLSTSLVTVFNVCVVGTNQRQVRINSMGSPVINKTPAVCS